MKAKRLLLLMAILMAGVASASHWASSTARAAANNASIPDFSGVWTHAALGFESPPSGPGPVTNKMRLPSGSGNFSLLVGDDSNPILQPQSAETLRRLGAISQSGLAFPDPDNQCRQNPVPYILWNFQIQMLQTRNKVTILYPHDQDSRHVRMNVPHPAKVTPSLHGDSVGHYEGDTLVIDTVGIKAAPYAMVDRFGTPFTEQIHVVERYRLIDYEATKAGQELAAKEWPRIGGLYAIDPNYRGRGLQLEFTVEDRGAFTMPWKAMITYGRAAIPEWDERVCAENVEAYHSGASYYSDRSARPPTADKPDF